MFIIIEIIAHSVLTLLGWIKYFTERSEKKKEREFSNQLIETWLYAITEKIEVLEKIGDCVNYGVEKNKTIGKIKKLKNELNSSMYTLTLLSLSNPLLVIKGLAYFKDRKTELTMPTLDIMNIRLKGKKEQEWEPVKDLLNELITNNRKK